MDLVVGRLTRFPRQVTDVPWVRQAGLRAVPYLIGAFFALWGLRGVECGTPTYSDAARHALNGALIHDYLTSGHLGHPIDFTKNYYQRFPALTLPYHPPLFPVFEAVFYAVFGVNLLAARLAVAATVLTGAVLLYRLVERTHKSWQTAAATTVIFFSLPTSHNLASDVMLEFPALALLLGALFCLRDLPSVYSLRQGLGFALLGAAAVWTKQQTVFVGLIPFLVIGLTGQWRLLKGGVIWLSSLLFGGLVLLLTKLPMPAAYPGFANEIPLHEAYKTILHHMAYYTIYLQEEFGLATCVFVGASAVMLFVSQLRKKDSVKNVIYFAWLLGLSLFLLLIGKYDGRYMFFGYPALVLMGVSGLRHLGTLVAGVRWAWLPPTTVAVLALGYYLQLLPPTMSGPAQAAEHVINHYTYLPILYCGKSDGAFIFAIRTLCPQGNVIRGEKLSDRTFTPTEFEGFAERHGIEYVVLEQSKSPSPWSILLETPPAFLVFEKELSLRCHPYRSCDGTIRIYRFTHPSRTPAPIEQSPTLRGAGV